MWGEEKSLIPNESPYLNESNFVNTDEPIKSPQEFTLTPPASRLPQDPFDALFTVIRDHGRPEGVEMRIGKMTFKFRSLATQLRLPLIALMVDSNAVSMELDTDMDLVLKLKHKEFNARFVVSLPFSGNVNLMFFIAEDSEQQKETNDDQDR